MNAYYKGQLLLGLRGPAGPDGNPVGTVISFLGLTAPKDYLPCDGAEYRISNYPELAEFFRQQFGATNHFGGDGTSTFAVPDMRNLFLRGYHGAAEKQLSGEIGENQEATEIPIIYGGRSSDNKGGVVGFMPNKPFETPLKNVDSYVPNNSTNYFGSWGYTMIDENKIGSCTYCARPVNTAVLYCIKAVETATGGGGSTEGGVTLEQVQEAIDNKLANYTPKEVYSTEETRIGTWIDGKPLYRMVVQTHTSKLVHSQNIIFDATGLQIENLIHIGGTIMLDAYITPLTFNNTGNYYSSVFYEKGRKVFLSNVGDSAYTNKPVYMIFEYTKTTDQPIESISTKTEQNINFTLDMPSMPVTASADKLKEED